jgi:drug/metabolite transporter (DMT)-like permease
MTYPTAIVSLVTSSVLWSSGGLLIKFVEWNPLAIAGVRSAISSIVVTTVARKPRFHLSFPQIGGAVSYAATVILFVSATKLTTAANAVILQYTAPIYVALFSRRVLQESIHWYDAAAVAVVLGGIFLFFLDDLTTGGYLGNVLALLAGFSMAWLSLLLRKQKDASPLETVLLGNLITAGATIPFMLSDLPGLSGWLALGALGVFQLGFSYVIYSYAIKKVRAIDAMLIFTIEPILNPVWVYLFIGEAPGHWAFVGGTLVLVAVVTRGVYKARVASKL